MRGCRIDFGRGGIGAFGIFTAVGSGGGGARARPEGDDATAEGGNPVGHRECAGAAGVEAGVVVAPDAKGGPERTDCGAAEWLAGIEWLTGVGARGGNFGALGGAGELGGVGGSDSTAPEIARSNCDARTFSCEARAQTPASTAASAPRRSQPIASSRAPLFHCTAAV